MSAPAKKKLSGAQNLKRKREREEKQTKGYLDSTLFMAKKPKVELSGNSDYVNEFISELIEQSLFCEDSEIEIKSEVIKSSRGQDEAYKPCSTNANALLFYSKQRI